MNNLVKRWVDALRSGEYKQGGGALRAVGPDGDEYCCLGVLCDLAGAEWEYFPDWKIYKVEGNMAYLPESVAQDAGVSNDFQNTLARMNDYARKSFEEIADAIETRFR